MLHLFLGIERCLLIDVFRYPVLNPTSSPRRSNDPDGYLQSLLQRLSEKISCCRERSNRCTFSFLPSFSLTIRYTIFLLYPKQSQAFSIRIFPFFFSQIFATDGRSITFQRPVHRIFHVGLSATKPHFTNQYVAQSNFIFLSTHNQISFFERSVHRLQPHLPCTIRCSYTASTLPRELHSNPFAWISLSPNGYPFFLL